MPQFTNITLLAADVGRDNDIVFGPIRNTNGLATYSDKTIYGLNMGHLAPVLTVSNSLPSKTSKLMKTRLKLVQPTPVFETVDGEDVATPVKDYEDSVDITFTTSERSAVSSKNLLRQAIIALLKDDDLMVGMLIKGETIYA